MVDSDEVREYLKTVTMPKLVPRVLPFGEEESSSSTSSGQSLVTREVGGRWALQGQEEESSSGQSLVTRGEGKRCSLSGLSMVLELA